MIRTLLALAALLTFTTAASAQTTEALLDSVQHRAFSYFWNEANPSNGLVRDRSTSGSPASIAAVGFGLSAITVGIDHGWITRDQGRDRVLTTLNTFWNFPQGNSVSGTIGYKGLFWHFLDMNTGGRTYDSELSTIDTALLFAGMLHARQYFSSTDSLETLIRARADSIYRRADWRFMQNLNPGILMGFQPGGPGFAGYGQWVGYNEGMIIYILALGSPTHPATAGSGNPWNTWTSNYNYQTQYGQTYVIFPPLFGHQYSHCWVDFRYIADTYMRGKGITYFENSRRATLAQRAYCIANPGHFTGYSDSLWGLTASDDPGGYNAHGAPPAQTDNGTISPTAATSSLPFAPEISIPAIRNMRNAYPQLWGTYGFRDAFNLTGTPWYDSDFLGIDQGPMVLMIENYLNSSIWDRFMQNSYVQVGLAKAGFLRTTTDVPGPAVAGDLLLLRSEPNPFRDETSIRFRLPVTEHVTLRVYDVTGREVARLVDGVRPAGNQVVTLRGRGLGSGVYYYRLDAGNRSQLQKCVLLR